MRPAPSTGSPLICLPYPFWVDYYPIWVGSKYPGTVRERGRDARARKAGPATPGAEFGSQTAASTAHVHDERLLPGVLPASQARESAGEIWRPRRDSNPCILRERQVS